MRRTKKLARPTGASSSASRLGPGMETVELRFSPVTGWDDARPAAGCEAIAPWIISWEVGLGASVDRGLRLARVRRAGSGMDGAAGAVAVEHYVFGEPSLTESNSSGAYLYF